MAYSVYATDNFEKELDNFSVSDQEIIKKLFLQLKENPYVGDEIRYKFFREKRLREKRIYYLIYEDLSAVLIVALGGKKARQQTINEIVKNFSEFKSYLKRLLKTT